MESPSSTLIDCPCGCGLRTNGTTRCGGCDRDISNAHWDGTYESCGDCADISGDLADNYQTLDAEWAAEMRVQLRRVRTPKCGW